ncbi:MAG: chemotaxis protein CheB [Anaerolineales bacterium]
MKGPGSEASDTILGIGASAGGMHALKYVLRVLPRGFPAPILILQHLAPDHESRLPDLLDNVTELNVVVAEGSGLAQIGFIYIAPPNRHLVLGPGGGIHLMDTEQVHYSRPSVDVLFHSLAEHAGPSAIAVIVSGKGTDGADGARAVHHAGGRVIVEDPESAAHRQMPQAALRQVPEALVFPLDQIGDRLIELAGIER